MRYAMVMVVAAAVNLAMGNPFVALFAGSLGMVVSLVELRRTLRGE